VLDDLSQGSERNLAHHGGAVDLVRGSVLDEALVRRHVAQADVVYHLAAVVGVQNILRDPLAALRVNSRGAENVLDAAASCGAKVVLASTSEVNGKSDRLPMHEDADRVLGSTTVPRWGYATAKALDEHFALAHAAAGLRVVCLRYFNSYGPRTESRGYGSVVATFLKQALAKEPLTVHGDGQQSRCFTFVEDTARATVLAGRSPAADGLVLNVGADEPISIVDLAHDVVKLVGSSSSVVHVDPRERYGADFEDTPRRQPDNARIRSLLGWAPQTAMPEGLVTTMKWEIDHA
ncbi:MAG: NAD-dependent dehydratase, partial [Frankiales bacterium]|nr:NAD-dependent dehydratase [Frankiales bacterium]